MKKKTNIIKLPALAREKKHKITSEKYSCRIGKKWYKETIRTTGSIKISSVNIRLQTIFLILVCSIVAMHVSLQTYSKTIPLLKVLKLV